MHEAWEVGRSRSTCEPAEQGRGSGGGGGGGKGSEPRGTRPAKRLPDAVPGQGRPVRWSRVREVARRDKDARFTALLHHVGLVRLCKAYWAIRPKAAPGVDGVTWGEYGQDLEANLRDLHARVQAGRYRAKPSRRVVHPEGGRAAAAVGYRLAGGQDRSAGRRRGAQRGLRGGLPGVLLRVPAGARPHDALDALAAGITDKRVNWVLDADIRDFFGQLDHAWLRRFLRHRIADKRVLRLIGKWLAAGVVEDGQWTACEEGSPQGASVSPLLANIYLHYVLDLWVAGGATTTPTVM